MAVVGSPERANSPIESPDDDANIAASDAIVAPVVQYTQADFDRENRIFRLSCSGMDLLIPWFSKIVYDRADRAMVHCIFHINHPQVEVRDRSVRDTHLAIRVLNSCLLNPGCPVERNAQQVYQQVMRFLPEGSTEIEEQGRAEARRRIINASSFFFGSQMMTIVDDLIGPKSVRDLKITVAEAILDPAKKLAKKEAARLTRRTSQELLRNGPGSFVDALGCRMERMRRHIADHGGFLPDL